MHWQAITQQERVDFARALFPVTLHVDNPRVIKFVNSEFNPQNRSLIAPTYCNGRMLRMSVDVVMNDEEFCGMLTVALCESIRAAWMEQNRTVLIAAILMLKASFNAAVSSQSIANGTGLQLQR